MCWCHAFLSQAIQDTKREDASHGGKCMQAPTIIIALSRAVVNASVYSSPVQARTDSKRQETSGDEALMQASTTPPALSHANSKAKRRRPKHTTENRVSEQARSQSAMELCTPVHVSGLDRVDASLADSAGHKVGSGAGEGDTDGGGVRNKNGNTVSCSSEGRSPRRGGAVSVPAHMMVLSICVIPHHCKGVHTQTHPHTYLHDDARPHTRSDTFM